jgi:hypothetical protein
VLYNLACFHSLQGDALAALTVLRAAVRGNPAFRRMAAADPDFGGLRADPAFCALVEEPR